MTNTLKKTYAVTAVAGLLYSVSAAGALAYTDTRDAVRDMRNNIVQSTNGNCVRTQWQNAGDICNPQVAQAQPQPVVRHQIAKEERTVYFDFDKYDLTAPTRAKLNSLANNIKSDNQITGARIIGYADRMGSDAYNEKLSMRRAKSVETYLTNAGVVNARATEVRWLGESAPKTQCADNLSRSEKIDCLQPDRRVEVEIDYRP